MRREAATLSLPFFCFSPSRASARARAVLLWRSKRREEGRDRVGGRGRESEREKESARVCRQTSMTASLSPTLAYPLCFGPIPSTKTHRKSTSSLYVTSTRRRGAASACSSAKRAVLRKRRWALVPPSSLSDATARPEARAAVPSIARRMGATWP